MDDGGGGGAAGDEVLESLDDWEKLLPERRAVSAASAAQQQGLLPPEGWALVDNLLAEAEEHPPRRQIGRAPSWPSPNGPWMYEGKGEEKDEL